MKKLLVLAAILCSGQVFAEPKLENHVYGSGTPGEIGRQAAVEVEYGIYHAPQYMPYFPTAATIWPRVIEVECETLEKCFGYDYLPKYGRAEYLFIRPVIKKNPAPPPNIVLVPSEPKIIYVEVPKKGIGQ